jgi:mRNA interferase HigB
MPVRIISKKKLRDYYKENTQSELPLTEWYFKMKHSEAANMNELKRHFNFIDYVNGYTIFDIGGNNYRLITAIHYNSQCCYVRAVWTHAEYSKHYNQLKLERGDL